MNEVSQQRNRREFLRQTTQAGVLALGATGPRSLSTAGEPKAAATIQIGILPGTFGSGTLEARSDAVKACGLDCVQVSLDCAGLSDMPDAIPLEAAGRIRREAASRGITIASVFRRSAVSRVEDANTVGIVTTRASSGVGIEMVGPGSHRRRGQNASPEPRDIRGCVSKG